MGHHSRMEDLLWTPTGTLFHWPYFLTWVLEKKLWEQHTYSTKDKQKDIVEYTQKEKQEIYLKWMALIGDTFREQSIAVKTVCCKKSKFIVCTFIEQLGDDTRPATQR